jgi:tetratricopeptide (TPR) repeat protein
MKRALPFHLALLGAALLAAPGSARACPGGKPALGAPLEGAPRQPATPAPHPPIALDDDDSPVIAGAESALAAEATRLFEARRWEDAALAARRVASGEAGDLEIHRRIAQYHLAVSLRHLGFAEASLALFATISERPAHPRFAEALRQVGALAEGHENGERFAALVSHYHDRDITILDTPADRLIHSRICYLKGWSQYRDHAYEEAIASLEKVDETSPLSLEARFLAGVSYVQLRKTVPAAKAFQRVAERAEAQGPAGRYLHDLALISLARAYYSSNHYLDEPCAPTIDANRLSAAVKYWNQISPESPLWADALFESSWAYFMAGDYPHALGNLHNFESGYLPTTLYPEADTLRGVIAYTTCQYEDATTIVARMEQRYRPIRGALATLLAALAGEARDEAVVSHFEALRAGRAGVPAPLGPFVATLLRDRPLARGEARLRALDAEEARLSRASARLRGSLVAGDIQEALRLARRSAIHDLAARVRSLYQDRLDDIDHQLREGRKLLLDAARGLAQWRLDVQRVQASSWLEYSQITPDVEHQIWPFDGEFWRDELGSYRQVIHSRCVNR